MKLTVVASIFVSGFVGGLLAAQAPRPSALPAERVTGIGGIFFKARDPKTLGAWYRDRLGVPVADGGEFAVLPWRDHDDPDREGSTVWALFGTGTDYFAPSDAPFMVNYRVRDLDKMLAQLRAAGVTVEPRVADDVNGKFAWVMDPEGHKIELWEPKLGF